jgi:hypothetical protein
MGSLKLTIAACKRPKKVKILQRRWTPFFLIFSFPFPIIFIHLPKQFWNH